MCTSFRSRRWAFGKVSSTKQLGSQRGWQHPFTRVDDCSSVLHHNPRTTHGYLEAWAHGDMGLAEHLAAQTTPDNAGPVLLIGISLICSHAIRILYERPERYTRSHHRTCAPTATHWSMHTEADAVAHTVELSMPPSTGLAATSLRAREANKPHQARQRGPALATLTAPPLQPAILPWRSRREGCEPPAPPLQFADVGAAEQNVAPAPLCPVLVHPLAVDGRIHQQLHAGHTDVRRGVRGRSWRGAGRGGPTRRSGVSA